MRRHGQNNDGATPWGRSGLSAVLAFAMMAGACGSSSGDDDAQTETTEQNQQAEGQAAAESDPDDADLEEADAEQGSAAESEDGSTGQPEQDQLQGDEDTSILGAHQAGQLDLGDGVVREETSSLMVLDPDDLVPVLVTMFDDVMVELSFSLPHYEVNELTITKPDGEAIEFGQDFSADDNPRALIVEGFLSDSEGWATASLTYWAGTTAVELDGNRAILRGIIGSRTSAQIQFLIDEHPEVDTLVLADIEGAVQDHTNQTFGGVPQWEYMFVTDLVREHGYTTVVPADGRVSDTGLLLFAAGAERIVETTEGGHWEQEIGELGVRANYRYDGDEEWDQYSAVHEADVQRWTSLLGEEAGTGLTLFLAGASADGPHTLSRAEIDAFGLSTNRLTTTDWNDPVAIDDVPYYFDDIGLDIRVQRPEELVDAFVDAYNAGQADVEEGQETAVRLAVFDVDQTVAYVVIDGFLDDSVAGVLARIVLEGDDEFGWVMTEWSERAICGRFDGKSCI